MRTTRERALDSLPGHRKARLEARNTFLDLATGSVTGHDPLLSLGPQLYKTVCTSVAEQQSQLGRQLSSEKQGLATQVAALGSCENRGENAPGRGGGCSLSEV